MKIVLTISLLLAGCVAQAQVRTLTRTVILFGDLENKISATANSTERASYLTDDFEERRCAAPGTPIARDQWLTQAAQKFSFSQQAVHDYGDTALYSALATADGRKFAIVDTWRKQGNDWKLAVRYICPATGERVSQPIPKKY